MDPASAPAAKRAKLDDEEQAAAVVMDGAPPVDSSANAKDETPAKKDGGVANGGDGEISAPAPTDAQVADAQVADAHVADAQSADAPDSSGKEEISEDKWWCDTCSGEAEPGCRQQHPEALMDPASAADTLQSRMAQINKELKATRARARDVQKALDALEVARASRGPRLLFSYSGWWDKLENGILDGEDVAIQLLPLSPISDEDKAMICAAFTGQRLGLDRKPDALTGKVSIPVELLERLFALLPKGVELKPGAVLSDGSCAQIWLDRRPVKLSKYRKPSETLRLIGYVDPVCLKETLKVEGDCEGRCEKICVFCCDSVGAHIVIEDIAFED